MSTIASEFNFCIELRDIIRTQRMVGRSGKTFEGLGALSSPNNLLTLRNLCLDLRPARSMEIGLSFGGSCLAITSTLREMGVTPSRQHLALDPYQKQVWDDTGLMAVEQAGLDGYLEFRSAFSGLELPRLVESNAELDLVYIDGSHLFEDVFVDFYYVARLLKKGGVVVFDDSSNGNVFKVLRFIRRNMKSEFAELDLGQYRPDGGRPLKYKLAKRLGKVQMTGFKRVGPATRNWNASFVDF
ncbi:MAG TPA: class I SAM-dependent methyltransferase [Blastocatellia bacterium]